MPLHLIKLCVGAESIADLEEWIAERVAERVRRGGAPRSQHVTRMVPARAPELVDGGSLYWVIKASSRRVSVCSRSSRSSVTTASGAVGSGSIPTLRRSVLDRCVRFR